MSLPDWREEPIAKKHDRASFDCGEPALNEFLRKHARQSHEKGAAKTFLAISRRTVRRFWASTVSARLASNMPAHPKSFARASPGMKSRSFDSGVWR